MGANGLHTFDLRKAVTLREYYNFHYYQVTDFDVGNESMADYAVSVGATEKLRYDIKPINLKQPKSVSEAYSEIFPGHKSVVTNILLDGDCLVTGAKRGELKVLKFNLFKGDLSKAPSCISIRN